LTAAKKCEHLNNPFDLEILGTGLKTLPGRANIYVDLGAAHFFFTVYVTRSCTYACEKNFVIYILIDCIEVRGTGKHLRYNGIGRKRFY
jgi:hypothetical protein